MESVQFQAGAGATELVEKLKKGKPIGNLHFLVLACVYDWRVGNKVNNIQRILPRVCIC